MYITTTHICLAIVMAALIIFAIAANRKIKKADPTKAPTGFLNVIELLVETLDNLVKSNMGKTLAPKFKNYIGVIFMFLRHVIYPGFLDSDHRLRIMVRHFHWH